MRKKSEGEKHRFVFLSATFLTLVIVGFWTVSLVVRLGNGTLSFDFDAPSDGVANIGQKIEQSWEEFFPSVKPDASAQPNATSTEGGEGEATAFEPEPEPEVILDQPQTEYYPADIYSN